MLPSHVRVWWFHLRPWLPSVVVGVLILEIAARPAPLVPIARAYAALCERYPILSLVTNHTPPIPLALLLSLAALALVTGGVAASAGLLATLRWTRRLRRGAGALPTRLGHIGDELGLAGRLTFLLTPEPMACCYGLLRPRIAITAGLLDRLDDLELAAVLAHERHHLRRHDPLRLLVLDALAAATCLLPAAATMRQRWEAQIELAADRAAFAVAPRGALAGALLAVLASGAAGAPGVAGFSVTEARITHLAGGTALPPIPLPAVLGSLGLIAVAVLGAIVLGGSADQVTMLCPFCPWFA